MVTNLGCSVRQQVYHMASVDSFLRSIARNSKHSESSYLNAITHFQNFLSDNFPKHTVETILEPLRKTEFSVYEILDSFVSFLMNRKLSARSIRLYLTGLRSYFAYYDIDVIPSKFKRRVKIPKVYREDEEPLDASDVRKLLLSCNNRRLKGYLLVLASGGLRAVEALAIRLKDVNFSVSPTRIHIRKEYVKTKISRDIYISDEATQYLKQWIEWKYRDKGDNHTKIPKPDDLVFSTYTVKNEANPNYLYIKVMVEYEKLLNVTKMDERKEGMQRRKITLHSLRRFVKTVISNQVNQDYSEWFLGHSKSPYYTVKEPERREIYGTKCMQYLTFLDYTTLEATGTNIQAKLQEKDSEIQAMKSKYEQDMKAMREEVNQQFGQIMSMIQQNPHLAHIKPEALKTKTITRSSPY
jgi:integrase